MGNSEKQGSVPEAFILVFEYDNYSRFSGFFKLYCIGQLPFYCTMSEGHSLYQGIGSLELLIG